MAECVHGSCLCGQLAFTAALPTQWVAHCHCTMCRRAHVDWADVDPNDGLPRKCNV